MSGYAGKVFGMAASGSALHPQDAWAGVFAYTFQIYFDFSGYSDMAIALARMFGIILPQNFNSPYKAVNVSDFWRRWHMTLSRFLRDYLYIPLGGNRRGEFRRYMNLMVTMGLGGLWHGAAWTFVLWGLFHGTGLAIQHGWQAFWSRAGPHSPDLVARRAIHLGRPGLDPAFCHGWLGLVSLGGCTDRAACAGGHVGAARGRSRAAHSW